MTIPLPVQSPVQMVSTMRRPSLLQARLLHRSFNNKRYISAETCPFHPIFDTLLPQLKEI